MEFEDALDWYQFDPHGHDYIDLVMESTIGCNLEGFVTRLPEHGFGEYEAHSYSTDGKAYFTLYEINSKDVPFICATIRQMDQNINFTYIIERIRK